MGWRMLGSIILLAGHLALSAAEDYPAGAVAIAGVGEYVLVDRPAPDPDRGYRAPVFIALSGDGEHAACIHGPDQLRFAGHAAISVLGVEPAAAASALAGLMDHLEAVAADWQIDPAAVFCVLDDPAFWPVMRDLQQRYPERIQGWLISCGRFEDGPYPRRAPRGLRLAGITYHPSQLPEWGAFIDDVFDNRTLCFDQPLVAEDDGYRLRRNRREKLRNQCAWLCYAWFTWFAPREAGEAYLGRLLPEVEDERALTSSLWTPNREARAWLAELPLWPGIELAPWVDEIPALRRAMLAADYRWLSAHDDGFRRYELGASLLADADWRRQERDAARALEDWLGDFAAASGPADRAQIAAIDRLATGHQQLWELVGRRARMLRLQPAFAALAQHFQRQRAGHTARDIAWWLQSCSESQWLRRLRLPRTRLSD